MSSSKGASGERESAKQPPLGETGGAAASSAETVPVAHQETEDCNGLLETQMAALSLALDDPDDCVLDTGDRRRIEKELQPAIVNSQSQTEPNNATDSLTKPAGSDASVAPKCRKHQMAEAGECLAPNPISKSTVQRPPEAQPAINAAPEGQPGAYAFAPHSESSSTLDMIHSQSGLERHQEQHMTAGLVEALPVSDEELQFAPRAKPMANSPLVPSHVLVLLCFGICLLCGIIVGTVCGSGLCSSQPDNSSGAPLGFDKTLAPTSYFRGAVEAVNIEWEIKHLLGREYFDPVTGNNRSDLVLQARQKALQWILHEDPLQLDTSDAQKLLQRFILVLFYYQTTLQQQWTECNPPNELTTGFCYYPEESSLASGLTVWGDYWLSGSHECQWAGVECTASREIAVLALQHNNLNGPLQWELSKLTQLKELDLKSNRLSGTIPAEMGALASTLEGLSLGANSLVGSIPTELFSSVAQAGGNQYLNLGKNSLTGPLPSEVGLSRWRTLDLSNNLLSSSIPADVFNSQYLEHFYMHGNRELTGTLPSNVDQMTNLQFLVFDGTGLSGTLPSELALLSTLIYLGLSDTNIGGTIPDALYTGLSDLRFLDLHGCQFSGTICTQLGLLSKLQTFHIADNGFTGTLPEEIGRLPKLAFVTLNGNNWSTGSVVPESFCESRVVTRVEEIVADCIPDPSTGVARMECPEHCCTACCDPSTGICRAN